MLNIDKNKVDFLVTKNMVNEVRNIQDKNVSEIRNLVDLIIEKNIEKIYFVAGGSPLCASETVKFIFDKYSNIWCETYSGCDFCDNAPKKLDEKCALIAISHYGRTEEVVKATEIAKKAGAITIGITNKLEDNHLAKVAEHVVLYDAECIWEAHLIACYTFALDLISKKEPCDEIFKIIDDMKKLPEILENLIESFEEEGRILGEKASKWDYIYTVAGGPLKPLAYKEGIVTLLEFTWTHGSVINSSEFKHGPLEIVEEGVPFIFLLGTDESRKTTERALNFVKRYTNEVIVFDYNNISNGLHPMLAPMVLFVQLEWFCYYLSIYKDHNPDDRRYYGGKAPY